MAEQTINWSSNAILVLEYPILPHPQRNDLRKWEQNPYFHGFFKDIPKVNLPLKATYTGWWYTYPSEKYEFVSWDEYSQYMEKKCSKPPSNIYSAHF